MASFTFNIAKGAVAEKVRDGANLGLLILRTTGLASDATLIDLTTITAVLAASPEVANTNYARKTVANASVTLTVVNASDWVDVTFANQTWSGVAAGDGWSKAVVYEDAGGADGTRIPLTAHDFVIVPDGSDVQLQTTNGVYRAS